MIFPQPKSFRKQLFIGFSFVVVPLLGGLVYAGIFMDRLANQSQQAVYQAAKATQTSRTLLESVTRLERFGRQYQVLGDDDLLNEFKENHALFKETAKNLSAFPLDKSMSNQLTSLVKNEQSIYNVLIKQKFDSKIMKETVSKFSTLSDLARKVLAGSNRVVDKEVQALHDVATTAQNQFVWVGVALLPGVILIVIIFSIILTRPIRQIDQAIRTLGSGEFTDPVIVSGPEDLQNLGQRLNWLRLRLAEVEEEKAKFVRHVSHELKTPLTAIREGADLLDDSIVGSLNEQQKRVVEILVSNTSKLQHLIEDLLNFSVAHTKQTKTNNEQVHLIKLITGVLVDQKLAIISKKLNIKTKLSPVAVTGDKEMLRVVIDNLLSNAVKFSPQNGQLIIIIKEMGLDAVVDIIDNGPGIKDSEKERVFDAFFQGEAKALGHIKGTGVGLSIAKEFIGAHGGKITVTDNHPTGAHITLRLPMRSFREEIHIVDEDRLQVF
ncbi:MAG: histidine kinase [Gammaproteobacteria bacterium]|nr:histidine kinase [Gammaproteobacteria bacterium]